MHKHPALTIACVAYPKRAEDVLALEMPVNVRSHRLAQQAPPVRKGKEKSSTNVRRSGLINVVLKRWVSLPRFSKYTVGSAF